MVIEIPTCYSKRATMFSDCFIGQIVLSIPLDLSLRKGLWSAAPESADSPAGRSLDDGFRSPTAGSASSLRLLSSPARPQCESASLFAAVRRQQHKAMRSRHMAVIIGRQHPVLRRQLSSNLSWPAHFPAAMVVGKLSRTSSASRSLFMTFIVVFSCRWRPG